MDLAYDVVRAFGVIVSVGVHGEPPLPFTGRQCYNKNISLDFGRCPARAMFPPAFDLLGESFHSGVDIFFYIKKTSQQSSDKTFSVVSDNLLV